MQAAASARSMVVFPEAEREAVDCVQALAEALREDFVVWDLVTHRGRKEAKRRGIHETPRVVFRSEGPESVDAFQVRARALLRGTPVLSS